MNDDYNDIEEKIKEKDAEEKKTKHKVSGKSVFEIQEIIRQKAVSSEIERREKSKKVGENDHSGKSLEGDE